LLALATIKPQLVCLLAAWLLLWSLGDWRQRRRFVWGFSTSCVVLVAGAELLLHGWIARFYQAVENYRQYTNNAGPLEVLMAQVLPGFWWGRALDALLVLATLRVCWRMRGAAADARGFGFLYALILAATVVVIPMVSPYNQLLLLPAVFLLARHWHSVWQGNRLTRTVAVLALIAIFWPWVASMGLAAAALLRPLPVVQKAWTMPLYTSVGIPIVVFGLLALGREQILAAE